MNHSTPGLTVHNKLPESNQTHVHWVSDDMNHLILCHPLLLLPSIFPSIRVFSNESALHIRWLKYWSFSFNISPYSEHPELISFKMDWLDLLAVQGTLKSLLQHDSSKASILQCSARSAAAAAKSLQLCLTLCDPIDGSPPVSPVPGILQGRTLEWVAISFSNAWKWKVLHLTGFLKSGRFC